MVRDEELKGFKIVRKLSSNILPILLPVLIRMQK